MSDLGQDMNILYKKRFGSIGGGSEGVHRVKKTKMWKVLCADFFQKYISKDITIFDIAAGYCEFINNINAANKIAMDMNPDVLECADSDVKAICDSVFNIKKYVNNGDVDVFFASNFLEHLDNKDAVIKLFRILTELLPKGGSIMILQPNIRLVKGAYWDFIDHKVELTEKSLIEVAEMCDLKMDICITRFLPYTTKSALPMNELFVKLYLMLMPLSGFIFGKQSFLVFRKGE